MRKFFGYVFGILLAIGMILFVGSIFAFMIGPQEFSALYARATPSFPFFAAGLGLIVFCIILGNVLWPEAGGPPTAVDSKTATVMSAAPVKEIRCGKCAALNDDQAKFCDQCGGALRGDPPPVGIQVAPNASNQSAQDGVWDQMRTWLGW